ncbi:hypothetical protein SEA_GRAND2040_50 [Mycobacterium phage Grand2040]|nr:hypothetical protein SEA_GRAND2040_50 [Mycobacterium phage Grand2040]
MVSVARQFPAWRQPDGSVWFRPADGDGWTADPEQAHADYRVVIAPDGSVLTWDGDPDAPQTGPTAPQTHETHQPRQETATMTAIDENGDFYPRHTEWMRYPLPPEPPRPPSKYNGRHQYMLPHPETGRLTSYPRATTVAKTLEDTTGLAKWNRRNVVGAVLNLVHREITGKANEPMGPGGDYTAAALLAELRDVYANHTKVGEIDRVIETIDNVTGGAEAREFGECVHAWLEALDLGMVLLRDLPDMVRPHALAYRRVLAHRGLVALPEYVERTVLNDLGEEATAGKIDRIFQIVSTGELVLGDVKTTKVDSMQYSWLAFAVQIGGVYSWAPHVLNATGDGWERMPKLIGIPHPDDETDDERDPFAILVHVPSDHPEKASAITIDAVWGAEALIESSTTRRMRSRAKTEVPRHAVPAPTKQSVRYAEARLALTAIESAEDGERVYTEYQDVWDDTLTDFATTVAKLL